MNRLFITSWKYILFTLPLISFNLYAQCFDYVGLKQRAGYEIFSSSIDADITDTGIDVDNGQTVTTKYNREVTSGTGSIGYYLQYCATSGFFLDLNVNLVVSDTSELTDTGTQINKFTSESDGTGAELGIFVGYEF